MRRVGVHDSFGRSGPVDALFNQLGISSRYISEAVHTLIRTERR